MESLTSTLLALTAPSFSEHEHGLIEKLCGKGKGEHGKDKRDVMNHMIMACRSYEMLCLTNYCSDRSIHCVISMPFDCPSGMCEDIVYELSIEQNNTYAIVQRRLKRTILVFLMCINKTMNTHGLRLFPLELERMVLSMVLSTLCVKPIVYKPTLVLTPGDYARAYPEEIYDETGESAMSKVIRESKKTLLDGTDILLEILFDLVLALFYWKRYHQCGCCGKPGYAKCDDTPVDTPVYITLDMIISVVELRNRHVAKSSVRDRRERALPLAMLIESMDSRIIYIDNDETENLLQVIFSVIDRVIQSPYLICTDYIFSLIYDKFEYDQYGQGWKEDVKAKKLWQTIRKNGTFIAGEDSYFLTQFNILD